MPIRFQLTSIPDHSPAYMNWISIRLISIATSASIKLIPIATSAPKCPLSSLSVSSGSDFENLAPVRRRMLCHKTKLFMIDAISATNWPLVSSPPLLFYYGTVGKCFQPSTILLILNDQRKTASSMNILSIRDLPMSHLKLSKTAKLLIRPCSHKPGDHA